MTQVKKRTSKKVEKTPSLRDEFMKLDKNTQDAVVNYFNLHNAAIWIYSNLCEEAKMYISYCIELSQKANNIETYHKNESERTL